MERDGASASSLSQSAAVQPSGLALLTVVKCLDGPIKEMTALVKTLGTSISSVSVQDFLAIQEHDIMVALGRLEIENEPISPLARSRIIQHIRRIAIVAGVAPPALGTTASTLSEAGDAPDAMGQLNVNSHVKKVAHMDTSGLHVHFCAVRWRDVKFAVGWFVHASLSTGCRLCRSIAGPWPI